MKLWRMGNSRRVSFSVKEYEVSDKKIGNQSSTSRQSPSRRSSQIHVDMNIHTHTDTYAHAYTHASRTTKGST